MIALPSSNHPKSDWYPLKPEPSFRERVWGQKDLSFLYPSRPPQPAIVGEVWLTADDNRIANGPDRGKTLGELSRSNPEGLLGQRMPGAASSSFPLLVKFLFTADKLSVQVHPSDPYAREKESSAGKTEMWHILKAEPGAQLAIGFRQDVPEAQRPDRAFLSQAIASGEIERLLHWMEPHPGDTFFIPAGTVHAIGAGLMICEIQQNSDVTYRLYDYNRPGTDGKPRPLHVEKALDVMEWGTPGGLTQPADFCEENGVRTCVAACSYFITERIRLSERSQYHTNDRMEIWIAISGNSVFHAGGSVACAAGEAVILPAAMGSYSIDPQPSCTFLRTYTASLERDVMEPLRARGLSEAQLAKVCFPPVPFAGGKA